VKGHTAGARAPGYGAEPPVGAVPLVVVMGADLRYGGPLWWWLVQRLGPVCMYHHCVLLAGCRDVVLGRILKKMFETPYFRCVVVPDADTVEICGALKVTDSLGSRTAVL